MLKLYGGARSRASIVQWYLEEIGLPYEFVLLDMQAGAHLQPEFLAINPMGKVPAIADGNYHLWESGAILLYLAEKYGQTPTSPEQRGEIAQWVLFANATLGPGIFVEASRERESARLFPALNQIFEQQPYLLGPEFSVADVAVGSMLAYMPLMLKLDFSAYPGLLAYLKRVTERPAYQKVMSARAT
ncbi:glutathione S-transferase family protein [Trichocoleus sp. FACHB-591]|uniref:glutathione S-transferase family protein n=1 Tax=Trichocoleus sp. FACHB-591 TaxID=2692872 RepID=UPI001683CDDD|nr:glutathione S-transferase family protein [Trichocoleus sp. FACHB-591]MBD2097621.1 glutathione S-transferase family protein [Trichocoleus sp. FACHB-591]